MSRIEFLREPTPALAAHRAAAHIASLARASVAERGQFCLALSGGSTPRQMLAALAKMDLPWHALHVFQVDERVAPAFDSARNLNMIHETLIEAQVIDARQVHPMPVDSRDLGPAPGEYAATLSAWAGTPPVLDLVHLGLGDDGHTASLVPNDPVLDVSDADVALSAQYRGHRRLTLTYPIINRARHRMWLATGSDKLPMLKRVAAHDESIPAGRIEAAHSVVFTDLDVV